MRIYCLSLALVYLLLVPLELAARTVARRQSAFATTGQYRRTKSIQGHRGTSIVLYQVPQLLIFDLLVVAL
jgi:hypothetical protein